jgi:hypothetical protein
MMCVRGRTRRLRTCLRSLVSCCWECSRDRADGSIDQIHDDQLLGMLAVLVGGAGLRRNILTTNPRVAFT